MRLLATVAVAITLVLGATEAYPSYQARIPNGKNVSHPCYANDTLWPGVGHWNPSGGGERNPFGIDFNVNDKVWNATLCKLDSDGDGRTNGEELGDPSCVWSPGAIPSRITGITHPGVCEPVTSENCRKRNGDKLVCGATAIKSTAGVLLGLLLVAFLLR